MAYTICFLTTFAVLLLFLVYGLMHVSSTDSYFNCNRQLGWFEFGNSFAAASTSLATVLFFFVTLGLTNGLYILFSPLSFLLGTWLFGRFMLPRLKEQHYSVSNDGSRTLGSTLGEYIKTRYRSQLVKYTVMIITLLGILAIMLIELFVGVQIFDIFLKPEYGEYALYFIAAVTFIYTGLGGLNAVVQTDKWQFRFMMLTAFLLIIFMYYTYGNPIASDRYFPPVWGAHGVLSQNWALYANMVFVNILLIPSLLRNWQLIAATKSEKEIKRGFQNGVILTAAISLLFVIFGLLFFTVFSDAPKSMNGILTVMAESSNPIMSNLLFPMLFAACLMALLSTVDSSLLPVVQCLANDIFPKPKVQQKMLFATYMIATLMLTIFLYKVVFKWLKFDIISWLFTIFSLVTISSPAILLACFGKDSILRTRTMQLSTVVFTILGLFIALAISIYGNQLSGEPSIAIIQLNTPIAILVSSSLLGVAYSILKYRQRNYTRS